jgi:3',5'-cyclic AMP phosphodiesterase CpdA
VLQRVTASSALITFETDLPTRAHVDWGSSSDLGSRTRSAGGALAVRHRVELAGLEPGKPVHYRAVAGGDASAAQVFHPAPAAGQPIRFVVYGDMRGGHRVHAKILESIAAEAPDFVLVTGDLVARGSDAGDWQRFFKIAGPLLARFPFYPVAGNHDVGRSGSELLRMNELFALWPAPPSRPSWGHWYSFEVGGVHIVMLDSNAYRHAEQLEWLERDLAAARKRGVRAIFATTHDGPYSRGIHRGNRYAADKYAPVLARHGVAMVFSGHDHLYQRGEVDGLRYVVSGGGGAPLYPVRCGIKGKRRCRVDDGMQHAESAHHYVAVSVFAGHAQLCPRRPDRQPLEPCVKIPLR